MTGCEIAEKLPLEFDGCNYEAKYIVQRSYDERPFKVCGYHKRTLLNREKGDLRYMDLQAPRVRR